jgi:hypothetical protein
VDSATYQTRLESNACTYSESCGRTPTDDSSLCERHLQKERKRAAAGMKRLFDTRVARGHCGHCGTPRKAGKRCPRCAAKRGAIAVDALTEKLTVAADTWRKDGDGWERYRGKGRRGPPPITKVADEDLAAAERELAKARAALAYYASPEVQEQGRIAKQGVKNVAIAQLALAARFVDQIVDVLRGGGSRKAGT